MKTKIQIKTSTKFKLKNKKRANRFLRQKTNIWTNKTKNWIKSLIRLEI